MQCMTQNMNFNIFLLFNEISFRFLYKADYSIFSLKLVLFKISVKTLISIL